MDLKHYLTEFPFIAITRGIKPDEAAPCCRVLHTAGFRIIETPLNSPDPYRTIEKMAGLFGSEVLIGAGTVLKTKQAVRKTIGRVDGFTMTFRFGSEDCTTILCKGRGN